jgi:phosphopantothenoylcysteine decarboxylase/phosphopantothenate--cysteine ligase
VKHLEGKKILLGVTGSIAAYKTPLLVRQLTDQGAEVQVILTKAAKDFVTPLTLSTVSQHPVHCMAFDADSGEWDSHVELGYWADIMLVAPASANTLAKMACGLADNLLTATYLAAKCPVMIAPAMDLDMFQHPATQQNIHTLTSRDHIIIEPASGHLASGLTGKGRMQEPEIIVARIRSFFQDTQLFSGKNVLITAGPTHEPIDPVRFVGNHSSGKMGIAIADTFARHGAQVTLILGPTNVFPTQKNIRTIGVTTAAQMYEQVKSFFENSDIFIMAAAVADYTIESPQEQKIKKQHKPLSLQLKPTVDILKYCGSNKKTTQFVVGFALETDNEEANALKKLQNKKADMLVLNSANTKGSGFGVDTNAVTVFHADGTKKTFDLKPKEDVAFDIMNEIAHKTLTDEI